MQAVILAAGRGERMRALAPAKPLLNVLGMPLLERAVRTAQAQKVDDIIIVTGHAHDAVHSWADDYARTPGAAPLRLVHNEDWSTTENGASLLCARPHLRGPFLLLMADHVYTPGLVSTLCAASPPKNGAVLAVDGCVQRPDIDAEDVTHVQLRNGRVTGIDKGLHPHDGFDTGAFLCELGVMSLLQDEVVAGRSRIRDLMQRLADAGRLAAQRIDGHYWQDVDTPAMHAYAEEGLLQWAAGKPSDGAVARALNRPVSKRLTRLFAATSITPNQISFLAFLMGLAAAALLAQGSYLGLLLGGLLVQLASIVDGCDGELARLKLAPSQYGGWLDALLDRYADAAILAGLTWHVMLGHQSPYWMWLGVLAISGSFVSSYSAHKADALLPAGKRRIGRDTRSFVIMLGSVLALPAATLAAVALGMNLMVAHRIFAMRKLTGNSGRLDTIKQL